MKKIRFCAALLLAGILLALAAPCVFAAEQGIDSQYGYEETDKSSVCVTVTISNNGVPIYGHDICSTPLAHLELTVPYFDLAPFGLQDFYRYHTEGGQGIYTDTEKVRRPTLLHLYLYLLVKYAVGADVTDADFISGDAAAYLSGTLDDDQIEDLYGNCEQMPYSTLQITGSAMSLYMKNFWGHDENLMYYRNHVYPLMNAGWGATADYILLSDGDKVDLAMFDNWSFYNHGAFFCFGDGQTENPKDVFCALAGEAFSFQTLAFGTQSSSAGGTDAFSPTAEPYVCIYDENWNYIDDIEIEENGEGAYSCTFSEPGTYYLLGLDPNGGDQGPDSAACYAPATAKVTVTAFDPDACTVTKTADGILVETTVSEETAGVLCAAYQDGQQKSVRIFPVSSAGKQQFLLDAADFEEIRVFCVDEAFSPVRKAFSYHGEVK